MTAEQITECIEKLSEDEMSVLWRVFEEETISTIDASFELAGVHRRQRSDVMRAKAILHRLQKLGALVRLPDDTLPDDTHRLPVIGAAPRATWGLYAAWADVLEKLAEADPD